MIRYEVGEDSVARLVLDRPEAKNALTVEMRDEIVARVRQARADPDVRCLMITGVGDAFCAGMDLRQSTVADSGGTDFNPRATSEALRNGVQAFIRELWELDKPTVAAVNGTAVGPGGPPGSGLRLRPGDASRPASCGPSPDGGWWSTPAAPTYFPAWSACPGPRPWSCWARAHAGPRRSPSDWPTAASPALDELEPRRPDLAARLAAGPVRSLGLSKQSAQRHLRDRSLPDSLDREAQAQAMAAVSAEMAEGMAAFAEKRSPDFRSVS